MNKEVYENGARIQFTVDGNTNNLLYGTIIGIASSHIIDVWIVQPDKAIKDWPYTAIAVQNTFIRRVGENRPFGCENILGE